MNFKKWIYIFAVEICLVVFTLAGLSIIVDPFFHYHKPLPGLFYALNNERYQNDGILKHFDYESIIIGTSMIQNFKTSEFDKLFNTHSIKVPFAGAYYKEINENLQTAFETGHKIKYVVRGLDANKFIKNKDDMRYPIDFYPTYLYNKSFIDDLNYIFNEDTIKRSFKIIRNKINGHVGGFTPFDEYSNWGNAYKFGYQYVLGNRKSFKKPIKKQVLTENERIIIEENVRQNITDLVKQYPETTFYYFFTPYSIAYWGTLYEQGEIEKYIDAEQYVIELILECPNIKLFSFNTMINITCDLNNYKDAGHYGEWINTQMLEYMKKDIGLLSKENYKEYIKQEKALYLNYSYDGLFDMKQ